MRWASVPLLPALQKALPTEVGCNFVLQFFLVVGERDEDVVGGRNDTRVCVRVVRRCLHSKVLTRCTPLVGMRFVSVVVLLTLHLFSSFFSFGETLALNLSLFFFGVVLDTLHAMLIITRRIARRAR